MKNVWWKDAVGYQIYPRSFADTNGDGIGDIQGIINKLDYLKDLGIDFVWISPIYESPNVDNGYDISDFKSIASEYGTMDDFDMLLDEAHKRDIKLIMDLVINHTSDKHHWFKESRKSKDNAYRDYYIWKAPKDGKEPNNWQSIWGGSAWELDEQTDEYYLHVFAKEQPDLNWENPVVREEIYEMIRWWLDKGIDGFRVDAIAHIKKLKDFPDIPMLESSAELAAAAYTNVEGIDIFLDELKNIFKEYDRDIVTVGEASGVTAAEGNLWVGEETGKFSMVFQFEHLNLWGKFNYQGMDLNPFRMALTSWQKSLEGDGWNALFMENHDLPRSVSVWGDDKKHWEYSSKALATVYFLMQGTPFIYQGQEIGMTNNEFESIEEINDIDSRQYYEMMIEQGLPAENILEILSKSSRDNARSPMQWDGSELAGFSEKSSWLKVNPNNNRINVVDQLNDENSVLNYYKKMIELRKKYKLFINGRYDLILDYHEQVFAYTRSLENEKVLVITNMSNEIAEVYLPNTLDEFKRELILKNYQTVSGEQNDHLFLKPYEARVYYLH